MRSPAALAARLAAARRAKSVPVRSVASALAIASIGVLFAQRATGQDPTYVLQCERLFDGVSGRAEGPVQILVREGKIVAVGSSVDAPADAERIDLAGMTVTPGLIDAHTHLTYSWDDTTRAPDFVSAYLGSPTLVVFRAARNARKTLHAGFTTVRDMGCNDGNDRALAEAIASGLAEGPRVITSGAIHRPFGGGRTDIKWPTDGTAATQAQVVEKARMHMGDGCDWIKMYATSGTFDDTTGASYYTTEEIRAAVEVSHPRRCWVAAHVMGLEGARRAVAAGVRSLEHGSRLDDALVREMARKRIFLVPTLYHLQYYADHGHAFEYSPGYAQRVDALQKEQFASLARAKKVGVPIGCGSDALYTMHGENAEELVWLVRAGLTPLEALRAATSVNAELLGLEKEIGRVAPGFTADLVAFAADPATDITAVRKPTFVMKVGKIVRRP